RVPPGYDTVPLFIFWGLLLAWLLPWSVFLPQALRDVPLRWRSLRDRLDRSSRANLLFFFWALVIVGFFSFSTRQEYYTIPALPGMALLVGGWLARESSKENDAARRAGRISSTVLFVLGLLGFAVGMYLLSVSHLPTPNADLADLLKRNPQDYDFSLGHVLDLTPRALGAFRAPLWTSSLLLLLGTGLNWLFRRRGPPIRGNFALAIMMVGLLACVHVSF